MGRGAQPSCLALCVAALVLLGVNRAAPTADPLVAVLDADDDHLLSALNDLVDECIFPEFRLHIKLSAMLRVYDRIVLAPLPISDKAGVLHRLIAAVDQDAVTDMITSLAPQDLGLAPRIPARPPLDRPVTGVPDVLLGAVADVVKTFSPVRTPGPLPGIFSDLYPVQDVVVEYLLEHDDASTLLKDRQTVLGLVRYGVRFPFTAFLESFWPDDGRVLELLRPAPYAESVAWIRKFLWKRRPDLAWAVARMPRFVRAVQAEPRDFAAVLVDMVTWESAAEFLRHLAGADGVALVAALAPTCDHDGRDATMDDARNDPDAPSTAALTHVDVMKQTIATDRYALLPVVFRAFRTIANDDFVHPLLEFVFDADKAVFRSRIGLIHDEPLLWAYLHGDGGGLLIQVLKERMTNAYKHVFKYLLGNPSLYFLRDEAASLIDGVDDRDQDKIIGVLHKARVIQDLKLCEARRAAAVKRAKAKVDRNGSVARAERAEPVGEPREKKSERSGSLKRTGSSRSFRMLGSLLPLRLSPEKKAKRSPTSPTLTKPKSLRNLMCWAARPRVNEEPGFLPGATTPPSSSSSSSSATPSP